METPRAITDVLAEVGPRLKRVRTQRGVTLTELAAATGISKSTLSRLEAGQRKPSLELLLPIAQAHKIPLDELVAAPQVGDPRIRLTPQLRKGESWSR
jgi:transcriptional regulator with XRE-family HTH domain